MSAPEPEPARLLDHRGDPMPQGSPDDALEGVEAEQHETVAAELAEPAEVAPPVQLVRPTHQGGHLIAGTDLPVVPGAHEIEQIAQMAVTLSAADVVPSSLRGKPNDVFLVLLTARDLGVALTTAMREFHVIEGKVTLSPKVKLSMIRQQHIGEVFPHQPPRPVPDPVTGEPRERLCPCGSSDGANSGTVATWHGIRADLPHIIVSSTYTIEMAQRVKVKGGTLAEKDNWQNYPERMLNWRAVGYLIDDHFGEVGTGLYSPDEMGAITDEDGEPVIDVVGHADPIAGTRAPRGHKAPPPPEASEEQREGLRKRIDALPAAGRTALVAMWTEGKGTDSGPRLPPLRRLLARDMTKAEGLVKSFEQRARKGEWGDWSPPDPPADGASEDATTPPGSPPTGSAAAAPTDGAQPADDATAGDSTDGDAASPPEPEPATEGDGEQGQLTADDGLPATPEFHDQNPEDDAADHAAVIERIITEIGEMTDHDVRNELDLRGKSRNGTSRVVRRRLALYRGKDAGLEVTEAEIKAIDHDDGGEA